MKHSIKAACAVFIIAGSGVTSSQTFGGAPALSGLWVSTVDSQTGAKEGVETAMVTSRHHGGSFVRVTTVERGIGNAAATMNGAALRAVGTVNLCDGNGGRLAPCRNGQSIIGRMRTWDATGKGNGSFVVRSTSVNFPRNTLTKTLGIR